MGRDFSINNDRGNRASSTTLVLFVSRCFRNISHIIFGKHIAIFTFGVNAWIDDDDFRTLKHKNNKARIFCGDSLSLKRKWYILFVVDKLFIYQASGMSVLDFVKKWRPDLDVVVFYWNPLNQTGNAFMDLHEKLRHYNIREASFESTDCRKYGMEELDMFFSLKKINNALASIKKPKHDVSLIAVAKTRLKELIEIQQVLEKRGLKVNSYITNTCDLSDDEYDYKPHLPPDEYLPMELDAEVICEVVEKGQHSPTIRAIIALLSKKKLITNNKNIKEKDYYNPENIFILGIDSESKLKEFVGSPYKNVLPHSVTQKYTPQGFLERLGEL